MSHRQHLIPTLYAYLEASPRWMIVGVVVTPVVALAQGMALLQSYRKHHSEMPYPQSPSQGLVVSVDERSTPLGFLRTRDRVQQFLRRQRQSPPLRLLVIGDSLAAGVGVVEQATPVLPQSIARTLSQKLGGRPVYWTCIGKPGALLQETIRDIEMHDQTLLVRRQSTLLQRQQEQQPPMPKWQKEIDKQADGFRERRKRLADWWTQIRNRQKQQQLELEQQQQQTNSSVDNNDGKSRTSSSENEHDLSSKRAPPKNAIVQWWNQLQDDVRSFGQAWAGESASASDTNNHHQQHSKDNNTDEDDDDDHFTDPFQLWQQWKRRLQRRESLKGDLVGQYDIAVVLTGGNDLKQMWLPFMFRGGSDSNKNSLLEDDGKTIPERFQSIVQALQARMKLVLDQAGKGKVGGNDDDDVNKSSDRDSHNHDGDESESTIGKGVGGLVKAKSLHRRPPLVVFPAMPITLVPQLHSPPMSWFVFYIFRRLENYKRAIARKFPGEVLFVEPPPMELVHNIYAEKGGIYEDRKAEEVLLQLTNATQRMQENFQRKLQEYRDKLLTSILIQDHEHSSSTLPSPAPSDAKDPNRHQDDDDDYDLDHHHHPDESFHEYDKDTRFWLQYRRKQQQQQQRPMILSLDQLHPNDEGYDIWGRHIATEVLKQWNDGAAEE